MKHIKKVLLIIILIIISTNKVIALTTGITTEKLKIRQNATTDSTELTMISKGSVVIITNLNGGSKGNGCDDNWYQITYGKYQGYSCSTYIEINTENTEDEYLRPWTSPKKSIIGGAKYISDGYIKAGQYTSYLKKYNVNPESSRYPYNHQYMTNITAPYTEAVSSYNSYNNNGLLDLGLEFVIPVYKDMPDCTPLPTGECNITGQSEVKDIDFEKKLNDQGFPESYKIKLRALHEVHPNWSFISLNTNLSFDDSVRAEKTVGAIYYTYDNAYFDYTNNTYTLVEGSRWYRPSDAAVAYFLDPRNSLNLEHILQFERLNNSSYFTEETIKSVLKNTFMEGTSECDNQSYANIFLEAAKVSGVSPVYLASLSRQEMGTNIGTASSGNTFTYNGITYKWLYNFYNIGANSSAGTNAVYEGLLWASRGSDKVIVTDSNINDKVCMTEDPKQENNNPNNEEQNNNNNNENKEETNIKEEVPIPEIIQNKGPDYYKQKLEIKEDNGYASGFQLGTIINSIKEKIKDSKEITITDSKGQNKSNDSKIATGDIISILDLDSKTKYTYNIVVYGDINGDGNISASDYVLIKNYLLGKSSLDGSFIKAADSNKSNSITASDYVVIKNYLLGKGTITQD